MQRLPTTNAVSINWAHQRFLREGRYQGAVSPPYLTRRRASAAAGYERALFHEMPFIQVRFAVKPHRVVEAHEQK